MVNQEKIANDLENSFPLWVLWLLGSSDVCILTCLAMLYDTLSSLTLNAFDLFIQIKLIFSLLLLDYDYFYQ